jgi:hypothetical protein
MSSRLIVYITLAEIWNAHYRLVFQDSPLVLSQVLASIRQEIRRFQAENSLSSPCTSSYAPSLSLPIIYTYISFINFLSYSTT